MTEPSTTSGPCMTCADMHALHRRTPPLLLSNSSVWPTPTFKGDADVCEQEVHAVLNPQLTTPLVGALNKLAQGGGAEKRGGGSVRKHRERGEGCVCVLESGQGGTGGGCVCVCVCAKKCGGGGG